MATGAERETALAEFYEQWKDDGLVMLKWIGLQVCMRSLSDHGVLRKQFSQEQ